MSERSTGETAARGGGPPRETSDAETVAFFLRATAWCAVVATVLGVIVAPGLRGNASQVAVEGWDRLSASVAYAMFILVVCVLVIGAVRLAQVMKVDRVSRAVSIGGALFVVVCGAVGSRMHVPPPLAVLMAIAASLVATTGAWSGLRAPHTRALGVVLGVFGLCALVRVSAWEVAATAGERANPALYSVSRGLATAGVVLEGIGQLAAAAWLGTRSRFSGRMLSNLAIAGAFFVTWGAARGVHTGAPLWQSALHTALADASGMPPPFGLNAVATFLTAAGMLLAAVALAQRGQAAVVVCSLSLALIGRGAFDVPLRALAVTAASLWTMIAMADPRAMWVTLTGGRALGASGASSATPAASSAPASRAPASPAPAAAESASAKPDDVVPPA